MLSSPIGTVKLHPIPPWLPPLPLSNLGIDKDTARKKVLELLDASKTEDIMIFTNGSDIPNKGKGAAAIIEKENIIIKKHIPTTSKVTNYETELLGLILAIEAARRVITKRSINGEKLGTIYIFSNNQAAIKKSTNPFIPSTAQYLYLEIFHSIITLKKTTSIQLLWCPGHTGVTGNELADTEAKKAALDPTTSSFELKPSLTKLMQETVTEGIVNPFTEEEILRTKHLKSNPKVLTKEMNKLEKAQSSILNQLRSEHVGLNKYLKRIHLRGDPLCETCNRPESVNHFMTYCRRYKAQQKRMKYNLKKKKIV
ncbi:hypothetical protein O181_086186 [Austropuccinia psidii MF-1]|uniref:RNase H type-1 domain-containing protein n=1 Tax=Austropuccinia psidii MF-1 TaxID=1389203 RepID=A0A9Q3FZN5_9BASI|nr:hypothetical protein [Austropuccinia psidii MF-1]